MVSFKKSADFSVDRKYYCFIYNIIYNIDKNLVTSKKTLRTKKKNIKKHLCIVACYCISRKLISSNTANNENVRHNIVEWNRKGMRPVADLKCPVVNYDVNLRMRSKSVPVAYILYT